jgi:hypothetical protein
MGAVGVVLSFGTRLPGYETLYAATPLLQAIRAPVRFGYLGIVAVAMLAGFGAVALRRRLAERTWPPVVAVLATLATIEALAAPIGLAHTEGVASIYSSIRNEPGAIVAELPLPNPRTAFLNAPFMLNSTAHWKPMLNGYSGFLPDSYRNQYDTLSNFPDERSMAALHDLGVTHVFVHADRLGRNALSAIDHVAGLEELQREGPVRLYRLATE